MYTYVLVHGALSGLGSGPKLFSYIACKRAFDVRVVVYYAYAMCSNDKLFNEFARSINGYFKLSLIKFKSTYMYIEKGI